MGFSQGCKEVSAKGLTGEEAISKLTHIVFGSVQFLMGYLPAGPSFLLTVGQRLPSLSCCVSLCIEQFTIWQVASLRLSKQEKPERGAMFVI